MGWGRLDFDYLYGTMRQTKCVSIEELWHIPVCALPVAVLAGPCPWLLVMIVHMCSAADWGPLSMLVNSGLRGVATIRADWPMLGPHPHVPLWRFSLDCLTFATPTNKTLTMWSSSCRRGVACCGRQGLILGWNVVYSIWYIQIGQICTGLVFQHSKLKKC